MKKDHFMLWSLLAVAFFIFLGLSMCDDIHIGGWHLKSSGMADSLLASRPDSSLTATERESVSSLSVDTIPSVEEPDTMPKVVLLIGDSMVECLGPRMGAYCEASGHTLYNVIWYSSGTERYANARLISKYIEELHPDFIFLSLGGNELFIKDIIQKRDGYVKSILAEIGDIPYLWIGPPNWKPDTGINQLIASNVKPGCMFVSSHLTLSRKADGAHPDAKSSIKWMDSIASWMPDSARYKLMLRTPEKQTARATRQFLHQPGETP